MKNLLKFCFLLSLNVLFAQDFSTPEEAIKSPNATSQAFQNYEVFTSSSTLLAESIRSVATDVEALDVNQSSLLAIQNDKPNFLSLNIIHDGDTLNVKMQRHNIFTDGFIVRNQLDNSLDYNPGLYYRGVVNNKRNSLAVFNFFNESVNGIISEPQVGNRILGQLESSNQYVIYSDNKMTVTQDFVCEVDNVEQPGEILPQSNISSFSNSSNNCVRIFYELTNDIYTQNGSSVTTTMNWITSIHNIVATLYSDATIPTALSDVLIWQEQDPYSGSNGDKLNFFRQNRIAFNGDLAHLIDLPAAGGVAFINSLCQDFRHAFSGVSMNYSQLPTYSWTVNVVTHEMGHSMGSPHTHACFWNGDNTAIDSCGPNNGYSEGCDNASIPPNGGTIMSYCHLDSTGMNLALGFHPQVRTYLSSNVDTKLCLGTDCLDSCMQTVADVDISQTNTNSLSINIDDVLSSSWDYRVYEIDSFFPGAFITTNTSSFVVNNIQPNTYYIVQVVNKCSTGSFGNGFQSVFLTDADWCAGETFTDSGGLNDDYDDNENFIKTFYPDIPGNAITFNINDFNIENNFDFMTIYDGETINAPVFPDGQNLTGSFIPTTFFKASNPAGAITVQFTSDQFTNTTGWNITVSCETLSNRTFSKTDVSIYPNPFRGIINIESEIFLDSLKVYDIKGRLVYQKDINQDSKITANLNELSSGLYLMQLISGNNTITKKILKK